jgi:hypothetical protein
MNRRTVALLLLVTSSGACSRGRTAPPAPRPGATLRTDSARYEVSFTKPVYRVQIGFVYTNGTDAPVSTNYCKVPGPPALEKRVGGRWVRAYDPITLLCLSIPPFRLAPGQAYRGTLYVSVAERGANFLPQLEVDSIAGTYRLRWALTAGSDPDDPDAPSVEATSPPFELVGP